MGAIRDRTDGGGSGNAVVGQLLRQSGEEDKGLFLSSSKADLTWHLRGESKDAEDPPVGGHVDLPTFAGPGVDRHGALRIQFPADITGYAGADSNNITVRLFRNDSFTRTPTVAWSLSGGQLTIILGSTVAVSEIRTAIGNLNNIALTTSLTGAAIGSDRLVLPGNIQAADRNLVGGRDAIPPQIELLALPDAAQPHILAKYGAADTLQELLDEFEENDQGVKIEVVYGTDLTAHPEANGFVRDFYTRGAGAPSTEGDGGLTRSQVDSRVRALAKDYALRGGPAVPDGDIPGGIARDSEVKRWALAGGGNVPDSELPDGIARDAEVPDLVSDALTLRGPGAGRTDELPFLTRGGAWSKATTETFRELFASYVGTWPVAAGFIFRAGDLTDHDGRVYFVNTQHAADATDGPETNAAYTPLDSWVGTITQNWYRAGSLGLHAGALWATHQQVVNTDALPGAAGSKWLRLTDDPDMVRDGGNYAGAATYAAKTILQNGGAFYLTTARVTGVEPGVAPNWASFYVRIGYVDGAPDSLVGAPTVNGGGELVTQTRAGHESRVQLPSGGTTVAANPPGTAGDEITRISIAGTDYNLPNPAIPDIGRTERIALRDESNVATGAGVEFTPAASNPISVAVGEGAARILSGVSGNDFAVKAGLYLVDVVLEMRADSSNASGQILIRDASDDSVLGATSSTYLGNSGEGWIDASKLLLLFLNADTTVNVVAHAIRSQADFRDCVVNFTELSSTADADSTVTPSPSITSYTLVTGEQHPAAGSIAGNRYNVAWQVAQPDHVGAARIIGFKGAYGDGTGATILRTIDAGASAEGHPNIGYANGEAGILMPGGLSLADGETYTLRLQVFGEGVTSPALTTDPEAYADIVITAHAAATALYHAGRVPYDSNDADAAATVARIVFATHDTQTWGALPSQFTLDLPDDGADYQAYFAAASSAAQPSGFTLSGQPATQGFTEETRTIGGVEYKVWIQKPNYRVTHDSENGNTYGVTS